MIARILVATDFSEIADDAIRAALELAGKLGAAVTLLHVYSLPTYLFFDGSTWVPPARVAADILSESAHRLALARDAAAPSGVPIETAVEEGAPAEQIVRYAAERGFDLIVVGTHGRRGLSRLALGSVAERVVRTSSLPVLTVPPRKRAGR